MRSQKGVLKELPPLFCTHALKDSFQVIPLTSSLSSRKFALLKHRVLALLFARPAFFKITNSTKAWSLQPRLLPVLTSLMLSSSLVSTRSSKASHQVGPSITWTRKLSLTDSRNLLDCLPPAMPLSQQIFGWLKTLSGQEPASTTPPAAEARSLINSLLLIRWPVADPKHQMPFTGLILDFHLQSG